MTNSIQLVNLIADRNETPTLIATGECGSELFRFADSTEVIVTNGDMVTEDNDGFAELRVSILN